MGGGFDDGAGALFGFGGVGEGGGIFHEDAAADEDGFGAELHDQARVGGGGDASGGEIWDGELAGFGDHFYQFVGRAVLFRFGVEFFFAEDGEDSHLLHDLPNVFDGVDNIPSAGLPLGADHGRAFGDAPQSFSQIARAAYEWHLERMLVDMMRFVRGSKHFGFVNVVDAKLLQNLRLRKMSNAALRHHRNGNSSHDLANLLRRSHPRHAALRADLRRHPFKRHDGHSAGPFGDRSLLSVGDVHDDAAFEHFGEAGFEAEGGGVVGAVGFGHDGLFSRSRRMSWQHIDASVSILQRVGSSRYLACSFRFGGATLTSRVDDQFPSAIRKDLRGGPDASRVPLRREKFGL